MYVFSDSENFLRLQILYTTSFLTKKFLTRLNFLFVFSVIKILFRSQNFYTIFPIWKVFWRPHPFSDLKLLSIPNFVVTIFLLRFLFFYTFLKVFYTFLKVGKIIYKALGQQSSTRKENNRKDFCSKKFCKLKNYNKYKIWCCRKFSKLENYNNKFGAGKNFLNWKSYTDNLVLKKNF